MKRLGDYEQRALVRLRAKFIEDAATGCWLWQNASTPPGYGVFYLWGKQTYAHRASYELHVGPIPEGLVIDHLCRNRRCVNPEHLEPVTQRINLLRGETHTARNAAKTHCDNGHRYTEATTYRYANGTRRCRRCGTEQARDRRERAKA